MKYNWQQPEWPNFRFQNEGLIPSLSKFSEKYGRLSGLLLALSETNKADTYLDLMVTEAIKTSEIEGEYLQREDVVSSIKKNLGYQLPLFEIKDNRAKGIAELIVDAKNTYSNKLSQKSLFNWHKMLFLGNKSLKTGAWRIDKQPMQVVSHSKYKEVIHFEAPPSKIVPDEMKKFINWFNSSEKDPLHPLLRAGIAHLYFESIHPFEDGNGRIGRIISEKALAQGFEGRMLLSLSRAIDKKKKDYYSALETAQRSNEITPWLEYFVNLGLQAQIETEEEIEFTIKKTKFFDHFRNSLNQRQVTVIERMLKEGVDGFKGGMSAKKYITITDTSKATATRDLKDLANKGIFKTLGSGRASRYELCLDIKSNKNLSIERTFK